MSSTRPARSSKGSPCAGSTRVTTSRAATRCSAATNSASGSSSPVMPEMWGVMVGSTWSPDRNVPSAGSRRQMWSPVWPGVCTTCHSRPPRRSTSRSSTRTVGSRRNRPCLDRSSQARIASSSPGPGLNPSSPHGVGRGGTSGIGPSPKRTSARRSLRGRSSSPPGSSGSVATVSSVRSSANGSGDGSNGVWKRRWATTSQRCSTLSRPAPPKWSGWEWVTSTVWMCSGAMSIERRRSMRTWWVHGSGMPGSTRATPRSSSRT